MPCRSWMHCQHNYLDDAGEQRRHVARLAEVLAGKLLSRCYLQSGDAPLRDVAVKTSTYQAVVTRMIEHYSSRSAATLHPDLHSVSVLSHCNATAWAAATERNLTSELITIEHALHQKEFRAAFTHLLEVSIPAHGRAGGRDCRCSARREPPAAFAPCAAAPAGRGRRRRTPARPAASCASAGCTGTRLRVRTRCCISLEAVCLIAGSNA